MSSELRSKWRLDRWVRELEASAEIGNRIDRRVARIWPQKSNPAGAKSRRDPELDLDTFLAIKRAAGRGDLVVFERGRVRPVLKEDTLLEEKEEGEETTTRVWVPDWTHTGDRLKLLAYGAALLEEGSVFALNLNLGPEVLEAAFKSSRGAAGYLTERLTRHLRDAGEPSPAYAFVMEASPVHDLHLHGVIRSSLPLAVLRPALRKAGGAWRRVGSARQVHTPEIYDLAGWIAYIAKATFVTTAEIKRLKRRATGELPQRVMLTGATQSIRQAGARWYRERRASGEPVRLHCHAPERVPR